MCVCCGGEGGRDLMRDVLALLTGAVAGIAGGSLSINPPTCHSNCLTVATTGLLSGQLSLCLCPGLRDGLVKGGPCHRDQATMVLKRSLC